MIGFDCLPCLIRKHDLATVSTLAGFEIAEKNPSIAQPFGNRVKTRTTHVTSLREASLPMDTVL